MVEIQAYHCGNNQNKVLSFIYTTPCSFEIAFSLIISFDPLTQAGRQRQVLSELQLIHRVPLGETDKGAPSSGFRGRWWWQSLARLDVSLHFLSADPVVWCTTCPTIHSSPAQLFFQVKHLQKKKQDLENPVRIPNWAFSC